MANCPNCGQSTARTLDWACPYCGYPLVSGFFRGMSKTYAELRQPIVPTPLPAGQADLAEAEVEIETAPAEPEVTVGAPEAGPSEAEKEPAAQAEAEPVLGVEPVVVEEAPLAQAEIEEALAEPEAGVVSSEPVEVEPEGEMVTAEAAMEPPLTEPSAGEGEVEVEAEAEQSPGLEAEPPGMSRYLRRVPGRPSAEDETAEGADSGILQMTVEELHVACKSDSQAANERFAGTPMQITGIVGRIVESEAIENPCLILTSGDKTLMRNVLCVFDKADAAVVNRLAVGQRVTVQGTFDSCTISILVTSCGLVG